MNLGFLKDCSFIFNTLISGGFECFAVGGCVRDSILGKVPNDIDFTTNAKPEEIIKCFSSYDIVDIGKKYGTIAVINNGKMYEITTYRVDGYYNDSRHPDSVLFATELMADLSRRDFTINAMAMDNKGNVYDYFNGQEDLKNKIIRTVGNPYQRFSEDALRIIRAIRFSSSLGFEINKDTSNAIHELCDNVLQVHPQRIRDELSKILLSMNVSVVFSEYKDILCKLIPEINDIVDFKQNTPHHRYDVFTHTLKALSVSPEDLKIRMSLLLHDIAKPKCHKMDSSNIDHFKGHPAESANIAGEILSRFSYPSSFINSVTDLIRFHDCRFKNISPDIKRVLSKISYDDFKHLLVIQKCDILAQSEYKRNEKLNHLVLVNETLKRIIENNECYQLSDLMVNGNDIASLGVKGKEIGETLDYLLDSVINGEIINDYSELMKIAAEYIKSR